ncbi:MAG: PQQ-binding-like beta-propeller repeat protein, partial [Bryobacteraceae bacterium]
RNAFYYVLDRKTGQYLSAKAFAKQTWAKAIDDAGRPIRVPNTSPTEEGTVVYPSVPGATNWFSPSYSPQTKLFYVSTRENEGGIYFKGEAEYKPGSQFNAGGFRSIPGSEPHGAIRALDAFTGDQKWEFKLQSPPWAGVLSTAGGLVFGGTNEGDVFALDATAGKLLWRFQTGGPIISNPMTYLSGGRQQVAIAAGGAIFAFGLDSE